MNNNQKKSTYALLMREEEKGRNIFEAAVYTLLVACTAITVVYVSNQPVGEPKKTLNSESTAVVADAPVARI